MHVKIPNHAKITGYPNSSSIWITTEDFVFYIDGVKYIIPAGFVFDGYSIPRFIRFWRTNNNGWGIEAALIHDFMYRFHSYFGFSRKFCDEVFLKVMKMYGLKTAKTKYRAVRMFGGMFFGDGNGKPNRKVRRAMERNVDSWKEYRKDVMVFNKL